MISSKELEVHENLKKLYNAKNAPHMKYKKDGTLDMRYGENIRLYSNEYKKNLLMENRAHNDICEGRVDCYRKCLISLAESEIVEYFILEKIETN